jgi:hypothetical protein
VSPNHTAHAIFFIVDNLDELGKELESLAVGEFVFLSVGWLL